MLKEEGGEDDQLCVFPAGPRWGAGWRTDLVEGRKPVALRDWGCRWRDWGCRWRERPEGGVGGGRQRPWGCRAFTRRRRAAEHATPCVRRRAAEGEGEEEGRERGSRGVGQTTQEKKSAGVSRRLERALGWLRRNEPSTFLKNSSCLPRSVSN